MFILGNILMGFAQVLDIVLSIYMWVIIVAVLISWVNPDPYNPIVRFLHRATDPLLARVRRWFPFAAVGGMDFTPMIPIVGIVFIRIPVVRSLFELAQRIH